MKSWRKEDWNESVHKRPEREKKATEEAGRGGGFCLPERSTFVMMGKSKTLKMLQAGKHHQKSHPVPKKSREGQTRPLTKILRTEIRLAPQMKCVPEPKTHPASNKSPHKADPARALASLRGRATVPLGQETDGQAATGVRLPGELLVLDPAETGSFLEKRKTAAVT